MERHREAVHKHDSVCREAKSSGHTVVSALYSPPETRQSDDYKIIADLAQLNLLLQTHSFTHVLCLATPNFRGEMLVYSNLEGFLLTDINQLT